MRHRKAGFKLKRDLAGRRSLLRNLVTSTIVEERITTTIPKAKAAKPLVEKMITLAKKDTPNARREASRFLLTPDSVVKLFDVIGPRFHQRNGGYTRIVKLGWRKGDGADTAKLELVGSELVKRAAERAKKRIEPRRGSFIFQRGADGGRYDRTRGAPVPRLRRSSGRDERPRRARYGHRFWRLGGKL